MAKFDFQQDDLTRIRMLIRQSAAEMGMSLSQWAKHHGLSDSYLSEFMNGKKTPGPKILQILGFRLVWTLEPIQRGRPARNNTKDAA